jgi:hypothetical protein
MYMDSLHISKSLADAKHMLMLTSYRYIKSIVESKKSSTLKNILKNIWIIENTSLHL